MTSTPHQIPGRRRRAVVSAPAGTAVAYLRVSTDEQVGSGLGLEAQREAIRAVAAREGMTITAWHADEGLSGSLEAKDRPGLSAALEAVRNREAATLLVAKGDRLARNLDALTAMTTRAAREGWAVLAADGTADTASDSGLFTTHLMGLLAERERTMISTRTREALAALKARGVQLGQPTKVSDETITRIILETTDGRSLRQIAQGLMADGIPTGAGKPTWHPPQVQRAMDSQRGQRIAAELFPEQVSA